MSNIPMPPPLPFKRKDTALAHEIDEEFTEEGVLDTDTNADDIDSAEADRLAAEGRVKGDDE